jgi:hypothetical protein
LQWSEWVVNYDFIRQDGLAQTLRSASREWALNLREAFERLRDSGAAHLSRLQDSLASSPSLLALGLPLVLIVVIFTQSSHLREWLVLAWRLRVRAGSAPTHVASLSYRRMLHLLEKRGLTKTPEQTPLEFAAGLPSGALTTPVAQLTQAYQVARFGGRPPDTGKLASLLAEVRTACGGRASKI